MEDGREDTSDEEEGEVEPETISYSYETDLKTELKCKKNPGHENFIPIVSFTIDHFPEGFRQPWREDWVKAMADQTVHLSVSNVSKDRPTGYHLHEHAGGQYPRSGSGYVEWIKRGDEFDKGADQNGKGDAWAKNDDPEEGCFVVSIMTGDQVINQNFQRDACTNGDDPTKWSVAKVVTADHVVYDTLEVEDTKVTLFYDKKEDKPNCLTLCGRGIYLVGGAKLVGDINEFYIVIHDEDAAQRLRKACDSYNKLRDNLCEGDPAVCPPHPHGLEKYVTIGKVLKEHVDPIFGIACARVAYTCDTCPGPSGAGVGWWATAVGKGRKAQHSKTVKKNGKKNQ